MKNFTLSAILVCFIFWGCGQKTEIYNKDSINPILGNTSYLEKFGVEPNTSVDENLRISTHLAYVEELLRKRSVAHLSAHLQKQRTKLLDLLHEYRLSEAFPKNYDYADQRKPCFIDRNGNICAVGYLVEQTAGREFAEQINSLYQYADIYDMASPALKDWVNNSGLSLKEVAMIQPAYGPGPGQTYSYIEPKYGIASSILGGFNLASSTLAIAQSGNSNAAAYIGLLTGTASVTLGILNYSYEKNAVLWGDVNQGHRNLSMLNIGLGTATMFINAHRLLSKNTNEQQARSNLFLRSYEVPDNKTAFGIGFSHRF